MTCVCVCVHIIAYVCVCFCYYVELCLILLLVICLSYRYGGQSTPEHNYLALQKSRGPQGETKRQRERRAVNAAGNRMSYGCKQTYYVLCLEKQRWGEVLTPVQR